MMYTDAQISILSVVISIWNHFHVRIAAFSSYFKFCNFWSFISDLKGLWFSCRGLCQMNDRWLSVLINPFQIAELSFFEVTSHISFYLQLSMECLRSTGCLMACLCSFGIDFFLEEFMNEILVFLNIKNNT